MPAWHKPKVAAGSHGSCFPYCSARLRLSSSSRWILYREQARIDHRVRPAPERWSVRRREVKPIARLVLMVAFAACDQPEITEPDLSEYRVISSSTLLILDAGSVP